MTVRGVSRLVTQVVSVTINPKRSGGIHSMHFLDSFSGLTYLSLFLSARFGLFIPMGHRRTHTFFIFLAFAPMILAGFVGATRVSDFRHRGSDVLAGTALGVIVALIVYRYWHPWVTDQSAAIPWDVLRMDKTEQRDSYDTMPMLPPNDGSRRHVSHHSLGG